MEMMPELRNGQEISITFANFAKILCDPCGENKLQSTQSLIAKFAKVLL
jgi:hypothetical protein